MAIDPSFVGRRYFAPPVKVRAAEVAEFAASVQQDASVVPLTFTMKLAQPVLAQFFADPELGIALERTVHADQGFMYHRPIAVGDDLSTELSIAKLRHRGTADWVSIAIEVAAGVDPVISIASTFIISEES